MRVAGDGHTIRCHIPLTDLVRFGPVIELTPTAGASADRGNPTVSHA
jgi:hypothetical protein